MDAVGAADGRRVFVFDRAPFERGFELVDVGDEEIGGAHELHVEAGVEHVGRGHALMHEARFRPDDLGEMGEEGDDVVLGLALDLVDARDVELGVLALGPDLRRRLLRDDAELGHGVGGMRLDLEPDAKARLRRPDRRHFGPGVAGDHLFTPRSARDRAAAGNRPACPWDDAGRIDAPDRIIAHDVVARLDRLGDARHRVKLAHIVQQVRKVGDAVPVALEQREIGDVEAHQGREQPPVRLGDLVADQITLAGEPRLDVVERGEQRVVGFLVGRLRFGEAAAINAVIDVVVDLGIDAVDLGAQRLRIKIGRVGADAGEFRVEHADDLGGFVVDDPLGLLVPQRRHRDLAGIMRIARRVGLVQIVEAVDPVRRAIGKRRIVLERPALVAQPRHGDRRR